MKMIIMQGWSGSGKSTLAKNFGLPILSTDNYFMDGDQYKFDFNFLGVYHALNVLKAQRLMQEKVELCIDNTNLQNWQIAPYVHLAEKYGYYIQIVVASGNFKNTHNVPAEVVEQMKAKREELNLDEARKIPVTLKNNFKVNYSTKLLGDDIFEVPLWVCDIDCIPWSQRIEIAQKLKDGDFDPSVFNTN